MKVLDYLRSNRMINSFIVLFTGDTISSALAIISTALIIKAIGLKDNGIILMVQTYALFFDQIFNFKIFEGLIKFLSKSIYNKNTNGAKSYIKQGFYLDFATAIIATIIGVLCINLGIKIMGWNNNIKPYLLIYMSTVLINVSGVCIGVLRIFNKFNYISYINVFTNLIRTLLFLFGLIFKLKFNFYFMVELISLLMKYILYMIFAYKTLKINKLHDFIKMPLKIEKDFLIFSINTNLASTLDLPVNTLTTFMMNKYLGFEAISIYKVFEKIGSLVGKFSSPLNQILYPELNKYVAIKDSKKAINLSKKIGIGIGLIGVLVLGLVVVSHKYWLYLLIPNYSIYFNSLCIYILFTVFTNATASVHSLFMALGYIKYVVPILLIINCTYIIILINLIKLSGLTGVIIALFLQALMVVFAKIFLMYRNDFSILN